MSHRTIQGRQLLHTWQIVGCGTTFKHEGAIHLSCMHFNLHPAQHAGFSVAPLLCLGPCQSWASRYRGCLRHSCVTSAPRTADHQGAFLHLSAQT
jgi:hypothetical protein